MPSAPTSSTTGPSTAWPARSCSSSAAAAAVPATAAGTSPGSAARRLAPQFWQKATPGAVVRPAARARLGAFRRLRTRHRRGRAGSHQALAAVAAEGDAGAVLGAAARALGALARLGGRHAVRGDPGGRDGGRSVHRPRPRPEAARRPRHSSALPRHPWHLPRLGNPCAAAAASAAARCSSAAAGSSAAPALVRCIRHAALAGASVLGRPAGSLELVCLVRRRLRGRLVGRGVGRVALVVLHRAVQPPSGPGATPVMIAARRRPAELPASARASAAAAAHRSRRPRPPPRAPGAASGQARCLPD